MSAGVIPVDVVDAVCLSMKRESYGRYHGKQRWKLEFSVVFPEEHAGTILHLFLQAYDRIPPTSQLYQAVSVANNGNLRPNQAVTKAMFLHQMFRCRTRLAVPKNGTEPYTVIECLIQKLTG